MKQIYLFIADTIYNYGKSVAKDTIKSRIMAALKASAQTALLWTLAILLVMIFGILLDVTSISSGLIHIMMISYLIQSTLGVISTIKSIKEELSGWKGYALAFFDVTILGVAQTIVIPILGMSAVLFFAFAIRAYIDLNYDGGYFHWVWQSIKSSLIVISDIFHFFVNIV